MNDTTEEQLKMAFPSELDRKVIKELLEGERKRILKIIDSPEFLEVLAELEHEQWETWSQFISLETKLPPDLLEKLSKSWKPYNELTEDDKEKDRLWARKVLQALKKQVKGA